MKQALKTGKNMIITDCSKVKNPEKENCTVLICIKFFISNLLLKVQ